MRQEVVWLSHSLSPDSPAYGGGEGMEVQRISEISKGDTANSSRLILPNHLGTHIDAPRHFFDSGPVLMDYPADFWIFDSPTLVDVPGEDGYLISPEDIGAALSQETDLLLLRTGYEAYRGSPRYWERNPGLAPEFGAWLRENFPNLRAVGMDVISVTSRLHREKGREAHRYLLDPDGLGNPILPFEDMALGNVKRNLKKILVSPLRIIDADASPCTVFGFTF